MEIYVVLVRLEYIILNFKTKHFTKARNDGYWTNINLNICVLTITEMNQNGKLPFFTKEYSLKKQSQIQTFFALKYLKLALLCHGDY